MAKALTMGFDKVVMRLETKTKGQKDKARAMIKAGGDILVDKVKAKITQYNAIDTRTLYGSIGTTNLKVSDDRVSIDVTALGSRTRGRRQPKATRNAVIGFVTNYGRSYGATQKAGRPIFTEAMTEAEPEILRKWEEMMSDDK